MLRIHPLGFARRDSEKRSIESIDITQEAAILRGHLARGGGIVAEIGIGVPPIAGDFANGIHAVAQEVPKLGRPVRTRESAADANDGNRQRVASGEWRIEIAIRRSHLVTRGSRLGAPSQESRQRVDRGMIVDGERRHRPAQPLLQVACQSQRGQRIEPEIRQRLTRIDRISIDMQFRRDLINEPGSNL